MADNLLTRPMTAEDLGRFGRCFERNGSPRPAAAVAWQYDRGPDVPVMAELSVQATDGALPAGEIAAIYAVAPVPMQVGTRRVWGAQSLDTMTDARHRGRGLFKTLAAAVYGRCAEAGFRLVYGFPNGNSAPGFFGRLGWVEIAPVPFKVVPLRSRYLARRVPRVGALLGRLPDLPLRRAKTVAPAHAARIRPLDLRAPDALDAAGALWAGVAAPVAVVRDAAYLRWRFADKPGESYAALGYHDAAGLAGYVVYTVKEKHGGRVGYVMEMLHRPGRDDAGRALLRAALDAMARERADVCLAWSFDHAPNAPAHRAAGFRTLPERLRPIELHFGALVLDEAERARLTDARSWYLSYCDSDTV